jgi:hypothetical protein
MNKTGSAGMGRDNKQGTIWVIMGCAVVLSSFLALWGLRHGGSADDPAGFATTGYRFLMRHASRAGDQGFAQWIESKYMASWERDLERRVARGSVDKVFFVSSPEDSIEDHLIDTFLRYRAAGLRLYRMTGLDPHQYESQPSAAPSHMAYVHSDDAAALRELWRAEGFQLVQEPPSKTLQKLLRHPMKATSFVDTPFSSALFELIQQHPEDTKWWFGIYEASLASTLITIELPAGLDLEETIARLCRLVECNYRVNAFWGEVNMLTFHLERPGAKQRVGVEDNRSWPSKERIGVEPSHICVHHCPSCGRHGW